MNSIVLITTATRPPEGVPFLKMTDSAVRYISAKAAVFFWAAQRINKIVIADATGMTLLSSDELTLLKQMNVQVEQIAYFQDSELIKQKGKGYGEGEIIRFALSNSVFLQQEERFFKCTGKIYCRNFPELFKLIQRNDISNMFWRYMGDGSSMQPWSDIRFFYATRQFVEEHLLPAYLKSDDKTGAAEYYCQVVLNEKLISGKTLRPLLSGFCGGTGEQYFDASLGALDSSFPCWFDKKS